MAQNKNINEGASRARTAAKDKREELANLVDPVWEMLTGGHLLIALKAISEAPCWPGVVPANMVAELPF